MDFSDRLRPKDSCDLLPDTFLFDLSSRLPGKWTERGSHIATLAVRKDEFHSHLASVTLGESSAPSSVTWED